MTRQADPGHKGRRAFSITLGLLITAIGAVAILGPEAAHVMVAQTVGLLLCAAGVLALVALAGRRPGESRRAVLTWSIVAIATGVALMIAPVHGLAAAGVQVGLLLVGHGVTTAVVAVKRWNERDTFVVLASLGAAFLTLAGLALLAGRNLGAQAEQIVVGIDLVMFGAYLVLGRELIGAPSPSRRAAGARSRSAD